MVEYSGAIRQDEFNHYYEEETFSKGLNREDTLEEQTKRIIYFYTIGKWSNFEYGIKILISILPIKLKEQYKPLKYDTTPTGVEQHCNLFNEIQTKLEKETSMLFKKKFIKTYGKHNDNENSNNDNLDMN